MCLLVKMRAFQRYMTCLCWPLRNFIAWKLPLLQGRLGPTSVRPHKFLSALGGMTVIILNTTLSLLLVCDWPSHYMYTLLFSYRTKKMLLGMTINDLQGQRDYLKLPHNKFFPEKGLEFFSPNFLFPLQIINGSPIIEWLTAKSLFGTIPT